MIGFYRRLLLLGWVLTLLVSCAGGAGQTSDPAISSTMPAEPTLTLAQPADTHTAIPSTSTPVPLAALVNGEPITLSEFQAELERYRSAIGTELATGEERRVLDDMIHQRLLSQAAGQAGYIVDDALLEERYQRLVSQRGSEQSLLDWIAANGYTKESFRRELASAIAAAWMRDQIAAEVPEMVEQAHVRQILLYNSAEANQVLEQLQTGDDFADLAEAYDPLAKGDLGWFPRGYLIDPKLDDAVFGLEPGQYSGIVETSAGFHVLQLVERDQQRPLNPDTRLALQHHAVQNWLEMQRSQSEIQIFLP